MKPSKTIKKWHRASKSPVSLRAYARDLASQGNATANLWLRNKGI